VMFGSASPTLTENDVLSIATHLVTSVEKKPSPKWTILANDPQPLRMGESPWTDGYRLAQLWRQKAVIPHKRGGAVDVEGHLERLGVAVTDIELEDATTSGLAVQPEQGAPQIFVNRRDPRCEFPSGKRFTLAHELCHLLHDGAHGKNLAMISGPWAPRELEKRANAFAAALLMPPDLLKKGIGDGDDLDFGSLVAMAKHLEVSPDALAHHLENCRLISEATRDVLLAQLVNRPESTKQVKGAKR
jgi:Zn-dependent peptidase ImmA (M78 family)